MRYMMGIDIGTQSIRVAIVDEAGQTAAMSTRQQYIETPREGWAIQNPASWWDCVCEQCREAIAQAGISGEQVCSVGVDAHMHGAVPIAADGTLLSQAVQLYCDKRNMDIVARFENDRAFVERSYPLTANMPTTSWMAYKILWLKEQAPEIYEKAWKFVTPKDYINFCLTGKAVIDPSEATGTALVDCRTGRWSRELADDLGVQLDKMPEIYGASEVFGCVSERAAALTGLSTKTKVVAGCGDMMASLLMSGMVEYGGVADITGTGSIICFYTKEPVMDPRVMNLRYVADGWICFGCLDSSGGAFRWFRDTLATEYDGQGNAVRREDYSQLEQLAAKTAPGAEKLLFFPYLMGERTLGSDYSRGMFVGLTPRHTKGHLVRAILEGIAFEHQRTLEIMKAGAPISVINHSGGAANGELWNQIKADIYGVPVRTLEANESAVMGAALLGGVGAGIFPDVLEAAKRFTKVKKVYEPRKELAPVYEALFQTFQHMHDAMQPAFEELAGVKAE